MMIRVGSLKLRSFAWQAAVIGAIVAIVGWLAHNTAANLHSRGIMVGFDFLERGARFPISESLLAYDPTDSFGWAFIVGLGNTIYISVLVIVLSTVFGLFVALARRSANPLVSGLGATFVDVTRNTPIVVQLLFWYAVVTFGLPPSDQAISPLPGLFLTDRGFYLPRLVLTGPVGWILAEIAIGIALAIFIARADVRRRVESGTVRRRAPMVIIATVVVCGLTGFLGGIGATLEHPTLGRFNFMGGLTLTPEFVAVLLGLTFYSSAFAAEIIRGGIDAVPRGQWEAARAIGLDERRTLRLVVLPQALRVIIPPMTSQYINIVKNSTLALVVGYPELNFITATTINQTGQALEGIAILMIIFLAISLSASLLMNLYNRRVGFVAR